ncbi:Fe2OG dioxygenase domain-containing protein [Mycena sanguinolenta]|uniref:Fe2OG dioxygenase domain-containing protein n=1 Tax=Mycena sanguinolenta TaxID=230812 RepID=A0A8H7CKJ8_9AGAR|nr:Fe2OG dioxygenase domain-containing protein [Mycena sanguinolenta]
MSGSQSSHATDIEAQLQVLRSSLTVQVPYTGGVYPVKAEDLIIYYDSGENGSRRIDLGKATEDDLANLTATCQKATFGVGGADILDESYRKAGKMDLGKFAACFDVSGLLETVVPEILQGQSINDDKFLKAELYRLNVYGPGSFFKAHKDTPRSEDMIGSLVVVFPTIHAGGTLTLEHNGKSWVFDSAAELASSNTPSLAYIAFYSDVTHAVDPVQTGYRVTLTYNLFLADRHTATSPGQRHLPAPEQAFEDAMHTLLASPTFLPTGGFLAFGLTHQYPFPAPAKPERVNRKLVMPPTRLGSVLRLLKGSDARIRTLSEHVGLSTHVKVLYESVSESSRYGLEYVIKDGKDVLADDVLSMDHVYDEGDFSLKNAIEGFGLVVQRRPEHMEELQQKYTEYRELGYLRHAEKMVEVKAPAGEEVPVHWVTKITDLNRVDSSYLAYGNEAQIAYVYGNAALFVQVPPPRGRRPRARCARSGVEGDIPDRI